MTYWQYRKAMNIIERFNGFVTGAELCCRHCGESARFNPGGLFDEDNYECPHCGTIEKYCYYIPMTIKDYLFTVLAACTRLMVRHGDVKAPKTSVLESFAADD